MALARNAGFNFLGAAAPALLSIVTLPYIVGKLGAADFGLLVLVTAIVGYFALIDINLTAGSTKFVAQYNATGDMGQVHATASFGLVIYACIGTVGMLALLWFARPLVTHVFSIPPARVDTAVLAVQVASIGFLMGQVQAYLQSLLGALMRYDLAGPTEAAFGSTVTMLTVGVLALGHGLVTVVVLRVAMSVLQILVVCLLLRHLLPSWRFVWPSPSLRRELLGFSAYAFLGRAAMLTYAHADRLLIGAKLGVEALSYYAVPSTLANRVMALVFRLSGVMFPHASALAAQGRNDELRSHYLLATRYLFYLNGAISLTLATLAGPILATWLSADFAAKGTAVMVMLSLTLWLDSLTNLPSQINDGLGHPRVTGLFAVGRVALGMAFIAFGISQAGIAGAAAGHLTASLVMSTLFLVWVHGRTVPVPLQLLLLKAYAAPLAALLPVAGLMLWARPWATGWPGLLGVAGTAALLFAVLGWFIVVSPPHRLALGRRFGWKMAS